MGRIRPNECDEITKIKIKCIAVKERFVVPKPLGMLQLQRFSGAIDAYN